MASERRHAWRATRLLVGLSLTGVALAAGLRAGAPVRAQGPPASMPNAARYTVQRGDTLYSLARRYNTTVPDLAAANGMSTSSFLYVGRPMWVPGAAQSSGPSQPLADARSHTVAAGETLYGLAGRYGVTVEGLIAANGLSARGHIQVGQRLLIPAGSLADAPEAQVTTLATSAYTAYTVQPGDTLSRLAARFDTTASALRSANGLSSDLIVVGQRLRVPRPGVGPDIAAMGGPKRIEVDVSEQRVMAWQGDVLVFNFVVSTGIASHPTRRGHFKILDKLGEAYSSSLGLNMPYWLGIYWAGSTQNGFHGLPSRNGVRLWSGYLGQPISYGCIVLGMDDAAQLYHWSDVGTPVNIHD
jgi:LysM repeat protein